MKRYRHFALTIDRAYDERSRDSGPDLAALEEKLAAWGEDGWAVVGLTPAFVLLQREVDDAAPAVSVTLPDPASLPLGAVAWARRSDGRPEVFEVRPADPPAPAPQPCRYCGLLPDARRRRCVGRESGWCEALDSLTAAAVVPTRYTDSLAVYGGLIDAHGSPVRVQESSAAGAEELAWVFVTADDGGSPLLNADQARALAAALLRFANRLSPRAAAACVAPPEGP